MKIYFLELINGGLKKKIRAVLNVRVGTNGLNGCTTRNEIKIKNKNQFYCRNHLINSMKCVYRRNAGAIWSRQSSR